MQQRGLAWIGGAALAAGLIGCSSPEEVARETGLAPSATALASAEAGTVTTGVAANPAGSAAAGAVAFKDSSVKPGSNAAEPDRDFAYSWPAEVSAVPALVERLTKERDSLLAEQKAEWTEAVREFAGQDCVACTARSFEKTWEVVADLPRYLSLSAAFYVYSGGAHGNSAYDALVWDREAGVGIDSKAMFRSPAALQSALGTVWCKRLKAERMKRLGDAYSDDGVFTCPPIADLTVLVGSSDGKAFNRIGLIAAPYVAGSYAEGAYEVTVPVTKAVLDAVKPEYRGAFMLGT